MAINWGKIGAAAALGVIQQVAVSNDTTNGRTGFKSFGNWATGLEVIGGAYGNSRGLSGFMAQLSDAALIYGTGNAFAIGTRAVQGAAHSALAGAPAMRVIAQRNAGALGAGRPAQAHVGAEADYNTLPNWGLNTIPNRIAR